MTSWPIEQIPRREAPSLHIQLWILLHLQLEKALARTQVVCSHLTRVVSIANTAVILVPEVKVIRGTVATNTGIEDNETAVGSQTDEA